MSYRYLVLNRCGAGVALLQILHSMIYKAVIVRGYRAAVGIYTLWHLNKPLVIVRLWPRVNRPFLIMQKNVHTHVMSHLRCLLLICMQPPHFYSRHNKIYRMRSSPPYHISHTMNISWKCDLSLTLYNLLRLLKIVCEATAREVWLYLAPTINFSTTKQQK